MGFQRQYDARRGLRWVDKRGLVAGRLTYLEWVGYWHGQAYWVARCTCGTVKVVRFAPTSIKSCGCLQREVRQHKDFRTQQLDGTWRLPRMIPVTLPDGQTFPSITAMAKAAGVSLSTMKWRMKHKPVDEWMDPGKPSGLGQHHRKRLNKDWHATRERRHQPWSAANIAKANQARGK